MKRGYQKEALENILTFIDYVINTKDFLPNLVSGREERDEDCLKLEEMLRESFNRLGKSEISYNERISVRGAGRLPRIKRTGLLCPARKKIEAERNERKKNTKMSEQHWSEEFICDICLTCSNGKCNEYGRYRSEHLKKDTNKVPKEQCNLFELDKTRI